MRIYFSTFKKFADGRKPEHLRSMFGRDCRLGITTFFLQYLPLVGSIIHHYSCSEPNKISGVTEFKLTITIKGRLDREMETDF